MTGRSRFLAFLVAICMFIVGLSLTVTAAQAAAPGTPANVTAEARNQSLAVSWDAATGALSYIVAAVAGVTEVASCASTTTSCVLTGLTNGVTYSVNVGAVNSEGITVASSITGIPSVAAPGAPQDVSASRTDGTIRVEWSAPSSDGGADISSYTASAYTSDSGGTAVASCSTSGTECRITGLSNSVTYYLSVVATNEASLSGSASGRVTASNPSSPTSPRSVKVVRGNGYAEVTWSAASSLGVLRPVTYTARGYLSETGGEPIATCQPLTSKLTCHLGPLPNGTTYYVDVIGSNVLVQGTPSSPRVEVITATGPEVPRSVIAVQVGGDVVVNWQVPVSDGGLPITNYVAKAHSAVSGGVVKGQCQTSGDICTIKDLEDAPVYVDVYAVTGEGSGQPSTPRVRVILYDPPGQVNAVAGTPVEKGIRVSWQPPNDNGRKPIISYTARAWDSATGGTLEGECLVTASQVKNGEAKAGSQNRIGCPINGLRNGELYYLEVLTTTSVDSVSTGDRVGVRVSQDDPTAPREVTLLPGDEAIMATWTIPANDGGSPIDSYTARAWSDQEDGRLMSTCSMNDPDPEDSINFCLLQGLDDFEPAWIEVIASSDQGRSKYTDRQLSEPKPSEPYAPQAVQLSNRDGGVVVHWLPPIYDGGYPVRSYVARAYAASDRVVEVGQCNVKIPNLSCAISGLADAQHVWVVVSAVNTIGPGAISSPIDTTAVPAIPLEPTDVAGERIKNKITVTWTAVPKFESREVLGYQTNVWNAAAGGKVVGTCKTTTQTTCTVNKVKTKAPLFVEVRATNELGQAPAGNRVAVTSMSST